jgi:lysophospholipase L1-like esterase
MKKLVLYGDSNTYGYDAADLFGGRFSPDVRWAGIVAAKLADKYEVIEAGMNGRMIPDKGRLLVREMIGKLSAGDTLVIMLGTNDILLTTRPDHMKATAKMRTLLSGFKEKRPPFRIIVIGPVPSDVDGYHDECIAMNKGFEKICGELGFDFVDAAGWGIELAVDGAHFTEGGHRVFAARFLEYLKNTEK